MVNDAREHRDPQAKTAAMVHENVIAQLVNIQTHPAVRPALDEGRLSLHGWVYDIETGILPLMTAMPELLFRWPVIRIPERCRFTVSNFISLRYNEVTP